MVAESPGRLAGAVFCATPVPHTALYQPMFDKEKALIAEMQRVQRECLFVRDCTRQSGAQGVVVVELVGALTQYLPASKCVFYIDADRFSIEFVRELYEIQIVTYLQQGAAKAEELARVARG